MKPFLWFAVSAILFFMLARYVERSNIYFPMRAINTTPDAARLQYEEIYFVTSDNIKLHSWFIPGDKTKKTILFCHGNGGNISHRVEKLLFFHKLGLNTFIFDYRGYGMSKGSPSESGLYEDALAAYRYLINDKKIARDHIIPYGESLGGAVAIELVKREKLKALITEEAFTSVTEMARIVYPFLPRFAISSKFDSISKIGEIDCPKLIIHSVDDEIVPFSLGEALFGAAAPPKQLLEVRGSHNNAFFDSSDKIEKELKAFLDML
ncbi:MAG: alpha/beta hydrolase [Candidatus Omnitrophota bacterium]